MSVFLVHPDWSRDDVEDGFTSYSGRFEFEPGKVHHIIDLSSMRSILGADLVREARLEEDGDVLVLKAPVIDEPAARWVLRWRRVKADLI
jgi:hypothetical protein